MNWDLGHYEYVATQLLPASKRVVERLNPQVGETVLDIGCGTGNATLLLAERGAETTGVDPALRLLSVARDEARRRDLPIRFVEGSAEALQVADGAFDAVASVFGVIFAADPHAAVSELSRVLRARSRAVFSAWRPDGALAAQARIRRQALVQSGVASGTAPAFEWFSVPALTSLFEPYGFLMQIAEEQLSFTSDSALQFATAEWENNPLWIEARSILEPLGRWEATRQASLDSIVAANEVTTGFRATSNYVIVTASRHRAAS